MRIGIVGGGQLGRMLALAAHPLGIRSTVLDAGDECCASDVADHIHGTFDDVAALEQLASRSDVITFEFENVEVEELRSLTSTRIFPPLDALAVSQDRFSEKTLFQSLGIETPRFAAIDTIDELRNAAGEIGLPAVLKTRRMGYDGKGQFVLRESADIERAWNELGGTPLILEAFVPFDRELAIIAVRSREGTMATYPMTQTKHIGGILAESIAPPPHISKETTASAVQAVTAIAEKLDYVGALALELFDCDGRLLANEFAPRVHNSGHWTIDGAECSQFENHIRAVLDLPMGSTACIRPTAMLNLIGRTPALGALAHFPDLRIHLYRKAENPGRKVGHVTISADTHEALDAALTPIRRLIERYTQR
ncbi:MAG: 5-(carboxyamino)imidazole ribonucleotide synthase [Phycisphaerales bacterium]|nr:5-(carboxyamino)imidazole ribonucleotide synthase [Phycisphaerales bacterium]MCB9856929.1 5-(carboxyamino)imidazole ribonucleotide synthase [Phycisphaerales bacterium]MCB9861944.1 5-(carboxyamino)imidazole ribonucleotide synthase [Phycisphaerales bacterium]